MSSWRPHPLHSKLNCHFIDMGAYSERRIKDLASKSCYKTLCHAGLFCGASGRREERKNLHHLWRRVQNEICASKGFLLKMGRLCATAKCQSGLFVFTFQRRGCRIVVLFSQTKQTLSEWEPYECEDAPRDCDKSAHNSWTNRCHSRDAC